MPTSPLVQFEPIGFVSRAAPFDSSGWLFEPLYDGRRALLRLRNGECRIEPADDLPQDDFAGLEDRMTGLIQAGEAVLDGEVVTLDRGGRPLRGPSPHRGFPAFAAFDVLWLEGDIRPLPLARRREALESLIPRDTGPLFKIFSLEEHGRALYAAARRLDLDGIVARRLSDPYASESVWYSIRNSAAGQSETGADPFTRREPSRRHRRVAAE
jgi:bifunctional non-homologous end joining protein LigD